MSSKACCLDCLTSTSDPSSSSSLPSYVSTCLYCSQCLISVQPRANSNKPHHSQQRTCHDLHDRMLLLAARDGAAERQKKRTERSQSQKNKIRKTGAHTYTHTHTRLLSLSLSLSLLASFLAAGTFTLFNQLKRHTKTQLTQNTHTHTQNEFGKSEPKIQTQQG